MCSPAPRIALYHSVLGKAALCITANLAANVSVGSEAEVWSRHTVSPLHPPKADTRVKHRHVCFRPIAVIQASRRAAAHITHVRIIPLAFGKESGWIAGRTYGSRSTIRRYRCQVVWPSTGSVTRSPKK